jgi:hypothetical protein
MLEKEVVVSNVTSFIADGESGPTSALEASRAVRRMQLNIQPTHGCRNINQLMDVETSGKSCLVAM